MAEAPQEYDEATTAKLKKLAEGAASWRRSLRNWTRQIPMAFEASRSKLEALDDEEQEITKEAKSIRRGDQGGWDGVPAAGPGWPGPQGIPHSA